VLIKVNYNPKLTMKQLILANHDNFQCLLIPINTIFPVYFIPSLKDSNLFNINRSINIYSLTKIFNLMKKVISFKMVQKCTAILSFVLFFLLLSSSAHAQGSGNYLPSDQALDKLKQNANTLVTLMTNAVPNSHAYFIFDTKLAFNEEVSKAINNGNSVDESLIAGKQVVIASLTRTPQLAPAEQKDIILEFDTLLSR
jgi:hypothetical protein